MPGSRVVAVMGESNLKNHEILQYDEEETEATVGEQELALFEHVLDLL